MREAGRVVRAVLDEVAAAAQPGTRTQELDRLAEARTRQRGARPAFKGYLGYPASICISVNDEVVHGIPSRRTLQEGDLVGLDFGVVHRGFFGDAAVTVPVGRVPEAARRLLEVTREALARGTGPVLEEGLVLAVEPMVNAGRPEVRTLGDGWTAVTADGSLSAHFEHTIAITPQGAEILSLPLTRDEA